MVSVYTQCVLKAKNPRPIVWKIYCTTSNLILTHYTSLVHSHWEYSCQVWTHHTFEDNRALEDVLKFAQRTATHSWKASYEEVLNSTNLPTLERRWLDLRLLLFEIVNDLSFFLKNFIYSRISAQHNFRSHSASLVQPLPTPPLTCTPLFPIIYQVELPSRWSCQSSFIHII